MKEVDSTKVGKDFSGMRRSSKNERFGTVGDSVNVKERDKINGIFRENRGRKTGV